MNKKFRIIILGSVCILIVLIILLFPTLKSFYIRNFASTHTYLTYVEEKNLSDYKLLDSIGELLPSHNSYDFDMDVDFSVLLNGLSLNELFPLKISGNFHNVKTENTIQHALSFNNEAKDSLHLLLTEDNETITFSIPELSEHTLNLSESELSRLVSSLNLFSSKEDISYMESTIKEYTHFLIDELNHNSTLKRTSHNSFYESFYESLHTVDTTDFDTTQNMIGCTELKVTITYKELHQIITSFSKKILDDTTLLEFLDTHNFIKKQDMIVLLTNYLNTPFPDKSDSLSEDGIILSTFIDKNDTIIGRQFKSGDTTIVYSSITNEITSDLSLIVISPFSNFKILFTRSGLEDNWDGSLMISIPNTTNDPYDDSLSLLTITFNDMSKTEDNHTKGTIYILSEQLYSCSLFIECTEKDDNQCYVLNGSALLLPVFNATITARQDDSLKLETPNMDSVYSYEERLMYFDELSLPLIKHPITKDLYEFYISSVASVADTYGQMGFFTNNP